MYVAAATKCGIVITAAQCSPYGALNANKLCGPGYALHVLPPTPLLPSLLLETPNTYTRKDYCLQLRVFLNNAA